MRLGEEGVVEREAVQPWNGSVVGEHRAAARTEREGKLMVNSVKQAVIALDAHLDAAWSTRKQAQENDSVADGPRLHHVGIFRCDFLCRWNLPVRIRPESLVVYPCLGVFKGSSDSCVPPSHIFLEPKILAHCVPPSNLA
jgi:hypothetical protein